MAEQSSNNKKTQKIKNKNLKCQKQQRKVINKPLGKLIDQFSHLLYTDRPSEQATTTNTNKTRKRR